MGEACKHHTTFVVGGINNGFRTFDVSICTKCGALVIKTEANKKYTYVILPVSDEQKFSDADT